ncbi:MAG: GDP-mannose 4,6-dehydratase [Hyphomicrobiaceae bacterium]
MKVLITGTIGFVGPYLAEALRRLPERRVSIVSTALTAAEHPVLGLVRALDVTDKAAVERIIGEERPTHVVHLAGLAATRAANANEALAWQVHLFGTLNLAHAILEHAPRCVLLSVGSGQVYGATARSGKPLTETALLAPANTYEVTKAAGDLAVGALAGQGLASVRFRPFNHTGPGQTGDFVIPSFAMQIARIEAGLQPPVLKVGNLEAERDFLDVRDVVAAYALAVGKSAEIAPGTIMNVSSGVPRRIQTILDRLMALSRVPISTKIDSTRMRPSETPRYVGDATLAKKLLGWSPQIDLDTTLAAVLDDCRARVGK